MLRKNQPSFTRPVVCHGDLHPFNLLFEGREVVTVLDWELARLAAPAYAVGRTLVLLRLAPYPMSRITRTVIQPLATALARAFERRYRERNPLHEISVRWHEALHCLRTLAIVEVGASLASGSRLRRAADVWFPVASRLEHRFASDSDRIEVRERYLAGETANALAEAFDVSRATIFAILQRAGIKSRYRVLTDLDVVAATTMYEAGRSLASIAHHFGVAGPGRHGCVEGTAAS